MENEYSSVQVRIRAEIEAKLRRLRQFRIGLSDTVSFLPGRRSLSNDQRKRTKPVSTPHSPPPPDPPQLSRHQLHLPISHLQLGSATSPLPRKNIRVSSSRISDDSEKPAFLRSDSLDRGDGPEWQKKLMDEQKIASDSLYKLREKANTIRVRCLQGEIVWEGSISGDDFKEVYTLGSGNYGIVMTSAVKGIVVAVKKINAPVSSKSMKRLEVETLMVTREHLCPHIVQGYGYYIHNDSICLVMERAATCLMRLQKVRKHRPMQQPTVKRIISDCVIGLKWLEDEYELIHRDVKPSNVLLDWDGIAKLCDFGISGFAVNGRAYSKDLGCQPYMAPERFREKECGNDLYCGCYDSRSDVWSLGITQAELLRGIHPYKMDGNLNNDFDLIMEIVKPGEYGPFLTEEENVHYEANLCRFSQLVLSKDYRKRPNWKDLMKHAYIGEGMETSREYVRNCIYKYLSVPEEEEDELGTPENEFPPDWSHWRTLREQEEEKGGFGEL